MKIIKIFASSCLAGVLIAIGGIAYIAYQQTSIFLGALLFSFGLFTIITGKLHLYTGKIGYVFEQKPKYLLELLIILIGNLFGSILMGVILNFTRFVDKYQNVIKKICDTKINDSLFSIFILSIFCGVMIFLAVDVSKRIDSGFQKTFAICIPVIIFIVAGFEHVIANAFYFAASFTFSWKMVYYIMIMLIGNSIGSIIIWSITKIIHDKQ